MERHPPDQGLRKQAGDGAAALHELNYETSDFWKVKSSYSSGADSYIQSQCFASGEIELKILRGWALSTPVKTAVSHVEIHVSDPDSRFPPRQTLEGNGDGSCDEFLSLS